MRAKAYLVQESNGVWYAKYLNTETQWTKRSLETRKKSVARIKFGEFLTELDKADARRIEPMKFGSARDQYLRLVEANKARSWYIKQRQYFESTITPFFDDASYVSSIAAAAAYLGISRSAIRQLVESGQLSRVRLPSPNEPHGRLDRFLLDKADLDAVIERGKESQML